MEWANIATFNEIQPAEKLMSRLNRAGIPARIHDEHTLQKWFTTEPLASIRLQAERHHYNEAKELLLGWDEADGVLGEAVHCPDCGSVEVEYPQFTRKFVLPSIGLFLSTLGFVEKEFFCRDCHYTWPTKQKLQPATDVLGWPKT